MHLCSSFPCIHVYKDIICVYWTNTSFQPDKRSDNDQFALEVLSKFACKRVFRVPLQTSTWTWQPCHVRGLYFLNQRRTTRDNKWKILLVFKNDNSDWKVYCIQIGDVWCSLYFKYSWSARDFVEFATWHSWPTGSPAAFGFWWSEYIAAWRLLVTPLRLLATAVGHWVACRSHKLGEYSPDQQWHLHPWTFHHRLRRVVGWGWNEKIRK